MLIDNVHSYQKPILTYDELKSQFINISECTRRTNKFRWKRNTRFVDREITEMTQKQTIIK